MRRARLLSLLFALLSALLLASACSGGEEPAGRREPTPSSTERQEAEQREDGPADSTATEEDEGEREDPADEAEPLLEEEEEASPLGTPDFQLREPGLGEGEEMPGPDFQLREPALGTDLPGTILVPPAETGGPEEEESPGD